VRNNNMEITPNQVQNQGTYTPINRSLRLPNVTDTYVYLADIIEYIRKLILAPMYNVNAFVLNTFGLAGKALAKKK